MTTNKRGRPKSSNPKNLIVKARVDETTMLYLDEICDYYKRSRSEVIRRLIVSAAKTEMANILSPDYPGYLFPEDL